MTSDSSVSTQNRLLTAAVELFAKLGYSGTSTRDIARLAGIKEITAYRYYASKKVLYLAALEWELNRLRFRADLIGKLNSADSLQTASHALIELFSDAVAQEPQLVRLLHFSVLEFGAELHPVFLGRIRGVLDAMCQSISRIAEAEGTTNLNERAIVLAILSSIVSLELLYPVIWGSPENPNSEDVMSACYQLWSAVLSARNESTVLNLASPNTET